MIIKYILLTLSTAVVAVVFLFAWQMIYIKKLLSVPVPLIAPFERMNAQAKYKILFAGDSTGVGTGSHDNWHTVAGYFGSDFPSAEIINNSYNGRKLHQLLEDLPDHPQHRFDLMVIQIGANDILKFTPMSHVARDIPLLLAKAKFLAAHVVILHSGDIGQAPAFIWPFNFILTKRTLALRRIYQQACDQAGAMYIDLYARLHDDPLVHDAAFYATDSFHPSAVGYERWYQEIRRALKIANVDIL